MRGRPSLPLTLAVLAWSASGAGTVQAADAPASLLAVQVEGVTEDDAAFARAALALVPGGPVDEAAFRQALEAVRATDRFRSVQGGLEPGEGGLRARVRLEPWPALDGWDWQGVPPELRRGLLPSLRRGTRPGTLTLDRWRDQALQRLREAGYPEAALELRRDPDGRRLLIAVQCGAPALIRTVTFSGRTAPYGEARLLDCTGLRPGRTLWTAEARRKALAGLRKRFLKDGRFEWRADLAWKADGQLGLDVDPGPVVELRAQGSRLGLTTSLKELVPLARAERYGPELLGEGERRLLKFFRAQGHLDASVAWRREVLQEGPAGPERVRITYDIDAGPLTRIHALRFERNDELSARDLEAAAELPSRVYSLGAAPVATPDLLSAVESRIKAFCLSRGFPDAKVRRRLERQDDRTVLVFTVQEGTRRLVRGISLQVQGGDWGDPWLLAECLPLLFSDHAVPVGKEGEARLYHSDRRGLEDLVLRVDPVPEGFRLKPSRPLPFLKSDLAQVFTLLRQRLTALGALRPQVRLELEDAEDGREIRLEVPPQPRATVQRLVVQGAGSTRARAVLREMDLKAGDPLDPERLSRAQARVGSLGAFQRVELMGVGEQPGPKPPAPWKEGDLLLRLEERSPWVVSSSFGYDKSQGYHVGMGVQRLNVGGMGRTLDFSLRAGDGTIQNPTLRKIFPTGEFDRSVDMYSVGYTDPWFAPGILEGILPARAQLRLEGAYIEERRSAYLIRRRRIPAALEWRVSPRVVAQLGFRFERVDVKAAVAGIKEDELNLLARTPGRATISAPWFQVARDTRDNPYDPTQGTYQVARAEFANQLFGTSANSSYVKVDLRQQWNWPLGWRASAGVVTLGLRVGVARPTASTSRELPLSERFFAGGPFSHRGVEPDALGPRTTVPLRATTPPYGPIVDAHGVPVTQTLPIGGQALALINLEYRFPILGQVLWGEIFVDSGQVYQSLQSSGASGPLRPPLRTSLGGGLIWKLGIPIKIEYAADIKRIQGRPRTQEERDTQLKGILLSAGFQF